MNPDLPFEDPDLDNPYAAPRSTFEPEPVPQLSGGIPFTVGDVFNWSGALFKERPWPVIAMFWAPVFINWAFAFGLTMLEEGMVAALADRAFLFFITVVGRVIAVVVQVWLGIGMNRGMLKIARHEPVSYDIIFSGGRPLLTVLIAALCVGGIFLLPLGALGLAIGPLLSSLRGQATLTSLLLIVACAGFGAAMLFYLSARLMQFYYLVIDRGAGAFQSIQWSWQLTRGRAATIILVYLLQACVGLAGFLACCVGLIVALPLSSMISVVTYLALAEPAKPLEKDPPIAWVEDL